MKFTQEKLRQMIKEELESVISEAKDETAQQAADRIKKLPATRRSGVIMDLEDMADGDTEAIDSLQQYYPHVEDLAEFAKKVLKLI